MFVVEGFVIGLSGAIGGVVVGGLLNGYFVLYGIDFNAFMDDSSMNMGYKVFGVVHSKWNVSGMIGAVGFSILASVVASFIPASKAVKLRPSECLRVLQ